MRTDSSTLGVSLAVPAPVARKRRALNRTHLRSILLISAKEFGDRFRNGWVIASAAIWLSAICLTSLFGLIQIGQVGLQGYERTVMSLLNLVQYLVPLLGLLMGHDLLVAECEDRTLCVLLSTGISRAAVIGGKFLGGVLAISLPLVLGFVVSGVVIALNASTSGFIAFTKLACSALLLAITFVGAGLAISSFLRTRVQALVMALLTWGFVVFAFDLLALGILLTTKAPKAAQEIELACDTTHLNTGGNIHTAFDSPITATISDESSRKRQEFSWVMLNPVDLFRTTNLPAQVGFKTPPFLVFATSGAWIGGLLLLSCWKFRSQDL